MGLSVVANGSLLIEAIDQSELSMRHDKMQFYQKNGAERQIRTMNHKLEQILLEKQDTNQFLNAISADYKGVYIVDPAEDTLRYIYIPTYFKEFVERSNGSFSQAIQLYCDTLVFQEDKELFSLVFDFQALMVRLKQGETIGFSYRKNDGSKIYLQISIYDTEALDADKMLWIFMDMEREYLHRV